ncbi:hypothetical protein ASPZODRAFT_157407 [Penicilliopsis zonata CBS 506.65]|uniref:Poly [ADP-ribose] polymerase n=1 Tax=Penicilliopsis zonata CBS 506.65 TaxID=1073090 RepID=A0A1L9SNR1_9EURO|nr:hypothetical protein ASPZODRAFT_157407 [Penicilliopsis zonata CBS 506.65]OJJ48899.1 hypothetical protein ASPZODRAFT_157407 [Penicilliopsis zonata CBS 506.65]
MRNSFKNLVITLSGTFPGYKQADLKTIVESHGATFSSTVTEECTHLVTTQKEVDKKGSKYKQALKVYTCHIVSLDWLVESDEAKKPLGEKGYLFEEKKADKETEKPKKRTLEEALDIAEDGSHKKVKDAQLVSSKSLNVPVDEACWLRTTHDVYIDDTGFIWDATLNQTNAGSNNNKYYRIQILKKRTLSEFHVWTHWGRVGEKGQNAVLGDGLLATAQVEFQKKFKDKSGLKWENRLDPPKKGKYTFIEKNYEEDDDGDDDQEEGTKKPKKSEVKEEEKPIESTLPTQIQNLMTFIFNQQHFLNTMASMSYDAQKLPLGKLSKRTLRAGFQVLKDLSELVAQPALAASKYNTSFVRATEDLSNSYLTTIPHVFGRNRPPVLNNELMIKKEIELLEALTDMEVANEIMKDCKSAHDVNELDLQFRSLNMTEMTPLARNSTEFIELENYLNNSRGTTHHMRYSVIDIFRIERNGETERFEQSPYASIKQSNRRLLWHGSRSTNFGGILSQGLRIAPPEAPVNGYMFGKGVYFADMSSKSANYCCAVLSANMGLLMLCDVELGDPMLELVNADYKAGDVAKANKKIATLGKGRIAPLSWKDAGCVHENLRGVSIPDVTVTPGDVSGNGGAVLQYNEYIVYDVAQIRQRYLFHVHMS